MSDVILVMSSTRNDVKTLLLELAREGFEGVHTTDLEMCLAYCREHLPAVLILSIVKDEGIKEIINKVRRLEEKSEKLPRISIMVLSISSDGGVEMLGMGADDCLPKQPNIEELIARVKALIRRYHNNYKQ